MAQRGRPRKIRPEEALEQLNPERHDTDNVEFGDNVSLQLTPDLFLQALAQMSRDNQAATLLAISEMKKPSAEEQAKKDAERERMLNNERQQLFAARQGEEQLKRRQASCRHALPDGRTAFRAQVNSDGCFVAFCCQCRYTSPRILAPEHNRRGEAMDFHKLQAADLTIAKIEAMALNSPPPLAVPSIPAGMEVDLGGL